MSTSSGHRWRARPVASWCIRALVLLVPIVASVAVGVGVGNLVDRPGGMAQLLWWLLVFSASALTLVVVERAARVLLPLAGLLRLSLIFPDRAPSRIAVAVRAMHHHPESSSVRGADETEAADPDHDPAERTTRLLGLAAALNSHDRRTRGHSERVRVLSSLVAEEMGLDETTTDQLLWGSLLHDIGKLSVPQEILNKPGPPDDQEWKVLAGHPTEGERLASGLNGWLGEGLAAIGQHHERYDGAGYPNRLAGDDISLMARIVAVTDAFETMTAVRSYKSPMSVAESRAELVRCAGTHFDPQVVRAFLNVSIGKLHWAVGATALVAQLPLLGVIPRAGAQVIAGAGSATAYGTAVAGVAAVIATAGLAVGGSATQPAVASTENPPAGVVAVGREAPAPTVTGAAPAELPGLTMITGDPPLPSGAGAPAPSAAIAPPSPPGAAATPPPPPGGGGDDDGNCQPGQGQGNGYGHDFGHGRGHDRHGDC